MVDCNIKLNLPLNTTVINNAVESYIGSKIYLKNAIPIFICNIVYNRMNDHDEYFVSRQVKDLNFMIFKPGLKNHEFSALNSMAKEAMEAIENNYLKDLYFIIKSPSQDKPLECYTFSFKYKTDEQLTSLPRPTSTDIIAKTKEIFNSIEYLKDYDKLPNDIVFEVGVTYHSHTPIDYETPGFEKLTEADSAIGDFILEKIYKSVAKLGRIDTNHHTVKCVGRGEIFEHSDISLASNGELAASVHDLENMNNEANNIAPKCLDSVSTFSTTSESGTTACPCGVESYSPELILDTVLCNDCYYKQHIWCLGYIKSTDIASDYSCLNCSKKSDYKPIFDSFPEDSLNSQRLLALLRVSVMYLRSKNGEKSTVPFLNKLTTDLQKKLVTQLHKLKIVETKKGNDVMNPKTIEEYISKNFYNKKKRLSNEEIDEFCFSDSEMLHSEDSIIKKMKLGR